MPMEMMVLLREFGLTLRKLFVVFSIIICLSSFVAVSLIGTVFPIGIVARPEGSIHVYGAAYFNFSVTDRLTCASYENYSVTFSVESGALRGIGSIFIYDEQGNINILSENASVITVTSPSERLDMDIQGGSLSDLGNATFSLTLGTGDVSIFWSFAPISPIDEYFMLGVGLTGLIFLVFSPCWVIWEVKKHGVTPEAVERFGYAMLMLIVSIGLIVMYLWS